MNINEDIDFLNISSDSSEHANLPRVLTFHEAPDLFKKAKQNLTKSIKLHPTYDFNKLYLTKNNNKNNDINNVINSKNNKARMKLIDLDIKIQNGNHNSFKNKTNFMYKKTEKEKRNSYQLNEKKNLKKIVKDKISPNKNKYKNNIETNKKINSHNNKNTKINSIKNKNKNISTLSYKKPKKKPKEKKSTKQLTRNSTREYLSKQNLEFQSKFNLTLTNALSLSLKNTNPIKENKFGLYTRSSKILPKFKFDFSPKTKNTTNKIGCLLLKKNTYKKETKKDLGRLTLPPSIEKKINKNKNEETNIKEKKEKKKSIKENINININIINNNSNNIIRSKIISDGENNKNNNNLNKTDLFSKKYEILKNEKNNIKTYNNNNISLEKNIKTVRSFKDLLINTENKNSIKSHYALSKPGTDEYGHMKINQDSYLILEGVNGLKDFNIFGVFDGHGPEGHLISQFITRYIQLEFKRNKQIEKIKDINTIYDKIKSNNFRMLKDIFINADNILRDQEIESRNSGTTCVIVIHLGEHIICANAGDSRAILIYDKNENNNYKVFPLSVDSKPELKEEKDRIYKMGGIVEKIKNQYGQEIGPYRVWNKNKEYPGLAMSRSIGDFSGKNLGIIPDPQIIETNFGININYIVICSDGVWEFLNNDDVMKIGNKFYKENNPRGFCKEVVDYSTKLWRKEDVVIDDITIISVFF